jgi:hypothetical protein
LLPVAIGSIATMTGGSLRLIVQSDEFASK